MYNQDQKDQKVRTALQSIMEGVMSVASMQMKFGRDIIDALFKQIPKFFDYEARKEYNKQAAAKASLTTKNAQEETKTRKNGRP